MTRLIHTTIHAINTLCLHQNQSEDSIHPCWGDFDFVQAGVFRAPDFHHSRMQTYVGFRELRPQPVRG